MFLLKAKKEGSQTIEVTFYQKGSYSGALKLNTDVTEKKTGIEPSQLQLSLTPWKFKNIHLSPDITMIIYEKKSYPDFEYEVIIYSLETLVPEIYLRKIVCMLV